MSDDDEVTRRFDPRYSPAFQPGFDPRVHREAPPLAQGRTDPKVDGSGAATPARRDWPEARGAEVRGPEAHGGGTQGTGTHEPGSAETLAREPGLRFAVPATPSTDRDGEFDDAASSTARGRASAVENDPEFSRPADDIEPLAWWRRVNPWLIVLWVLGAVFVVAPFVIVALLQDVTNSLQNQQVWDYFLNMVMQMVWFGAPMMVVLGLATLTSTVVILALQWRRSPAADRE